MWGGFSHFGLGWIKDGDTPNPCEKYAHHVTRHWRGEDGAHIWSSNQVTGAEGTWVGDIKCIGERFQPKGPIMQGKVRGQYPSHWIATARSDKEVDVHGLVTLKLEGGGTYTAHVHEYIKFYEPCVKINRHYWKLKIMEGEYSPPTGGTNNPPSSTLTGTGESTRIELTSPGTCSVPSTTDPLRPMVTVSVLDTVSTNGATAVKASENTDSPILPGPWPGKDTPVSIFSPVSPRVSQILSFTVFRRALLLTAIGTDKVVTTGPPPTMSDSTMASSARKCAWLALDSPRAAACCGRVTKLTVVTGS